MVRMLKIILLIVIMTLMAISCALSPAGSAGGLSVECSIDPINCPWGY